MYQLDYVPIRLANLNDYFTRYRETRNEKYFNEFLYFYEPVLNRNTQLFITKYGLDSNRIDDLKQIFSSLLWCEMQNYDSDIPLLQLIKYKVLKAWHEYVRTVCGNVHINNDNLYQNLRKVAMLYSLQPESKPLEKVIADIAKKLNISENTVHKCTELIEFEILLYNRRQAVNTFSHIHVCRGNINLFGTNSQHLFSPPKTNSEKFTSFP